MSDQPVEYVDGEEYAVGTVVHLNGEEFVIGRVINPDGDELTMEELDLISGGLTNSVPCPSLPVVALCPPGFTHCYAVGRCAY